MGRLAGRVLRTHRSKTSSMPAATLAGEGSLTAGGTISAGALLSGVGTLTTGGVRAAIQELRDSSLEELRRLLAECYGARKAGDTLDTDLLAAKVETTTKMINVAKLLRAGAKWGVVTIIASLIGVAVTHEANDFMGWTPPPITIVRQMSPAQMDELSRQIIHHLQEMQQRCEHR
jgi:hypothetical protein